MTESLILNSNQIEKAVEILYQGGVIGYPTETVYGLGGIATDAEVISRIQYIKGRAHNKPMLILVPDATYLSSIVEQVPEWTSILMQHYWPGPLTLIFKAKRGLPNGLMSQGSGIGIRISSDPVCHELFTHFKAPLVSTSANPVEQPPARSAEEVNQFFPHQLDAIVDGGIRNRNIPSTVIDVRSQPVKLIRQGAIDVSRLKPLIGDLIV